MNFNFDLLIDVPIEKVFDFLVQPEKVCLWVDRVTHFQFLDEAEAAGENVRFKQILRRGGKTESYSGQIDVFDPPRQLRTKIIAKNYQVETHYGLTSTEEGTLLVISTHLTQSRWLTKWLVIIFSKHQRRALEKDLFRLRQCLTTEYGGHLPPSRRAGATHEFLPDGHHPDPIAESANQP